MGGATEVWAQSPRLERLVREALAVRSGEDRVLTHVHGFHSYPARLHPDTATTLIRELSSGREAVLDPFCGSGTVLVCARLLGRRAFGSDLNPIAVELSRVKSAGASPAFTRALLAAAEQVVEHARARQKAKLGPTAPYGSEDRALFATHVLLELDGVRDGIDGVTEPAVAAALRLVLSALLTKVSQRAGDSSEREEPKRIARGFVLRFFAMKARDLAQRLTEFTALVPQGTPPARVESADARQLGFVRDETLSLVVSSPPYPGVYDYLDHHRVRLRWLRLDSSRFARGEIGSRRAAQEEGAEAIARWEHDFSRCLRELRRTLRSGGHAALLLADSVHSSRPLHVERWLPPLVQSAELAIVAHAAQRRPHFHQPTARAFSSSPRREHLFVLQAE